MTAGFVIAARDAAGTLGETLESLRAQTDGRWRAVVVDDGSVDETAALAAACGDGRVRVVRQDARGLACARNRGFREIGADCVCFLDADDMVASTFVERMAGALEGFDVAFCAQRMVGARLEDLEWVVRPGSADAAIDRLHGENPFGVGSVLMRRDAPSRLGLGEAPFDESLAACEDWDLWLRLTAAGARWAPCVDEALFWCRLRAGSMSGDLEVMHRSGHRVIAKGPEAGRADARRQWNMQILARAAARGDRAFALRLVGELGVCADADVSQLAAMLRPALGREDIVGPADTGRMRAQWRGRVATALGAELGRRVVERLDLGTRDWNAMARWLMDATPSGRIVIYGMGRNGRCLGEALARIGGCERAVFVDDDPRVGAPMARLARAQIRDLACDDLVIITPDDGIAIMSRLNTPARVMTLADVSQIAETGEVARASQPVAI